MTTTLRRGQYDDEGDADGMTSSSFGMGAAATALHSEYAKYPSKNLMKSSSSSMSSSNSFDDSALNPKMSDGRWLEGGGGSSSSSSSSSMDASRRHDAERDVSNSAQLLGSIELAHGGGSPPGMSTSVLDLESDSAHHHRRLTDERNGNNGAATFLRDDNNNNIPDTIGHAILKKRQLSEKKRTLVVYSGPTSLDRSIGKNDIYLNNFDYFIEHGIECHGLGGTPDDNNHEQHPFEDLNVHYVIVLTQEVADRYTAEDGLITRKQADCRAAKHEMQRKYHQVLVDDNSLITVLVREDRCYDMESLLLVSRTYDIPNLYDHMVYINCGLAGPKFGPGSPEHWEYLSSWTELYTSLLSDKVQMVGHTINTHFNTVYSPHIQSFLFAVNTPMIDIWLQTGAIYECGISNEDFKDDLVKMALVWRYEVGISRVLLDRGYSIAAAFMHQQGRLGEPLVIDNTSTFGRHFDKEEIIHSDVFLESGVRRLTESSFPDYEDHRKYSILPWDCYVFFKVSRLIPSDIQEDMKYTQLGPVGLVPNDARRSSITEWRRKAGVSILGDVMEKILPSVVPFTSNSVGPIKCYGRHCEFEQVATTTGELLGFTMIVIFVMWYMVIAKFVERRISVAKLKQQKWK